MQKFSINILNNFPTWTSSFLYAFNNDLSYFFQKTGVYNLVNTSILLIELFISNTSIMHIWCNLNEMIESTKRTDVLTCIKIKLKTWHSFKSLVMFFEFALIKKFIKKNSRTFFQLGLWQPWTTGWRKITHIKKKNLKIIN